jgi:prepilin-type N-terminal cleavage/methylation domain-containing protein
MAFCEKKPAYRIIGAKIAESFRGGNLMKRDRGFTIMELIVVIAVVAILSSIAVPPYLNWRSSNKFKDAFSLFRGDLERAKSHAIKRNEPVAILISADGYSIFVDDGSGGGIDGNWNHEPGEEFLLDRSLPAGIRIDLIKTTFGNDRTCFNGRGWIGNPGKVTFLNKDGTEKVLYMENRFGRITTN